MSQKGEKKNAIKNNKKDKKPIQLKLDNDAEVLAETIYKKYGTFFKISDIDINKIRVSNKQLYMKMHNPYKYVVFYEDFDKYIPLRIVIKDVPGFYNDFKDNGKTMNLKFDDKSTGNIIDIFEHIGKKLKIDFDNYLHEDNRGDTYLRTKVLGETCFRKNKDKTTNTIKNERTKYNCRVLLQTQSVYYSNKDVIEDTKYYPQVLLEQCRYISFVNNKLIHDVFDVTDSEPDFEPDLEDEEFNEMTVQIHILII